MRRRYRQKNVRDDRRENMKVTLNVMDERIYRLINSEEDIDSMETMDPLFPVDMPADMSGGQEGTAQ